MLRDIETTLGSRIERRKLADFEYKDFPTEKPVQSAHQANRTAAAHRNGAPNGQVGRRTGGQPNGQRRGTARRTSR
jgi:hypothetical protein